MKNKQTNVGSFATAKLQAKRLWRLAALVAAIAFSFAACGGGNGNGGGKNGGNSNSGGGTGGGNSGWPPAPVLAEYGVPDLTGAPSGIRNSNWRTASMASFQWLAISFEGGSPSTDDYVISKFTSSGWSSKGQITNSDLYARYVQFENNTSSKLALYLRFKDDNKCSIEVHK